jgi:hypothetical protein
MKAKKAQKKRAREKARLKKIKRIMSMKGKLEFDLSADEMRHAER